MKICQYCNLKKDKFDFFVDNSRIDKLSIYCKYCYKKISWEKNNKNLQISYEEFLEDREVKKEEKVNLLSQGIKKCYKCNIEKTIDCFTKNKNSIDGLDDWCRECKKQKRKINYEKNRIIKRYKTVENYYL